MSYQYKVRYCSTAAKKFAEQVGKSLFFKFEVFAPITPSGGAMNVWLVAGLTVKIPEVGIWHPYISYRWQQSHEQTCWPQIPVDSKCRDAQYLTPGMQEHQP